MIARLALGIRLAVGGGRISGSALLRLAMTTIGIALAVAVLLPAVSVGNVVEQRSARAQATTEVTEPRAGVDPLLTYDWSFELNGDGVEVSSLAPTGPSRPLPPGLSELPDPGELVVSPEVARRLAAPDGEALRARLPGTVVGVIGKPGVVDANDLVVFSGTPVRQLAAEESASKVYGYGVPVPDSAMAGSTASFVLPVAVALILPLLIFVTTAAKMGAAQRERRLAGLRLLGVDARGIRQVAAGESLVGALAGLLIGAGLFVALRPLISGVELFGLRFYGEDFVPPWPLVLVVALLVPGLAVLAAIFGLRRITVEPLGVLRQGRPPARRVWWRSAIACTGALLVAGTLFVDPTRGGGLATVAITLGSALLLLGVTALLPWAVQRVVGGLRGGPPSWQLAVRRLQLDGATASRVVAGLVVVLAGAILVQSVLTAMTQQAGRDRAAGREAAAGPGAAPVSVGTDAEHLAQVRDRLRGVPGVRQVYAISQTSAEQVGGSGRFGVLIGDCPALNAAMRIGDCADGDVFAVDSPPDEPGAARQGVPSGRLRFALDRNGELPGPEWTVQRIRHVPNRQTGSGGAIGDHVLLATPAALNGLRPQAQSTTVYAGGSGDPAELANRAAAAVSSLAWDATVYDAGQDGRRLDAGTRESAELGGALLAASLVVVALAALNLLLLSVQQIGERRRPLAALSASGVPIGVLARSALWQTAIPVCVGVLLAVVTGIGLTGPVLRLAALPVTFDVGMIGMLAGAAMLLVLLTTALTLPALRQVTRPNAMRAE